MSDWLRVATYFAAAGAFGVLAAWLCRQSDRHYNEARRLMEDESDD